MAQNMFCYYFRTMMNLSLDVAHFEKDPRIGLYYQ